MKSASEILVELSQPFPDKYVHRNPSGGGSYVKHHVVEQRLIAVLGYPPSFERVEIIRGDVAGIQPNPEGKSQRAKEGRAPLINVIVGVVARMEVSLASAYGERRTITVEEAGDCEEPHNWTTDGQRLKDAMSDAYKRCAMRLGCGLHLWSGDEFFLHDYLVSGADVETAGTPASPPNSAGADSYAGGKHQQTESGSQQANPGGEAGAGSVAPSEEAVGLSALIIAAVNDGRVAIIDVIQKASMLLERNDQAPPKDGIDGRTLPTLGTVILKSLIRDLGLEEKASA